MSKNNQTPDEYQDENERREDLTRWLRLYFSDQNLLPDSWSWRRFVISYDAADREIVIEIALKFDLLPRPDRETCNFGYDQCWEGVED